MNFGGFLDSGGAKIVADIPYSDHHHHHHGGMPTSAAISQPRLTTKSMFSSPGLSLALQTSLEGQGERMSENNHNYESSPVTMNRVRPREEEHDISRSGSDNMDGGSGDDQDAADGKPPKKKRYHRHTPQQIQELESLFKECPHPDEKQRLELSRRLSLETRQVKFWFQNRRTQMKTQLERHENSILRQENDKLRAENLSFREAMRSPMCSNCGGPAMVGEITVEEQHLRMENARLKEELERVCTLAGKFFGRPVTSTATSAMPSSSLELGMGMNVNGFGSSSLQIPDYGNQSHHQMAAAPERSMYLELALASMDELMKLAQNESPLWLTGSGGRLVLDEEEYVRTFNPVIGVKPNGFVTEASRESGLVIINSLALVETLMDANKWAEMFPTTIARTTTTDIISSGMGGSRNGALQLMQGELQVLSPLVPVREVNFLRFCKQHAEGVWAVVDVSVDSLRDNAAACGSGGGGAPPTFPNSRRLPSGCLVQDMPNGYSKVTWIEHSEYDESVIHQLFQPLISSGMGFGAQRWIATLQRQCECLAILMSSNVPAREHTAIAPAGRRSMLKLAQRMTDNFCAGVCASTVYKWNKLNAGNVDEDVRVMTRKSIDDPGEPPGIVLSAATSVWMPVSPQRLFDFLRDERLRSEWDILSNGGPMQEMHHIAKGQDHGNCVSLLRASPSSTNSNQNSMLILQETSVDAAGSLVVYAPVDIPAMHVVMNGGDSAYVALLPSGFAIVPDGGHGTTTGRAGGSLLTVAFQILVNTLPTAKLTLESVETVNNLISCTVQKIKAALNCES